MRSGVHLWRPDISGGFPWHAFTPSQVSHAFSWVDPGAGLPHIAYSLLSVPSEAALQFATATPFSFQLPMGPIPSMALPLAKWQKIKAFIKPQWEGKGDQVIWANTIHKCSHVCTHSCAHRHAHLVRTQRHAHLCQIINCKAKQAINSYEGQGGENHAREITTMSNFRHEQVFVCVGSKPRAWDGKADSPFELKQLDWVPL